MSFLNRENFDADALMNMSSDSEQDGGASTVKIVQKSQNLARAQVTSETTQIQSQTKVHMDQAYTPAFNAKEEIVPKQITNPTVEHLLPHLLPNMAIRSKTKQHLSADEWLKELAYILDQSILKLNDLLKNNVHNLYSEQFTQVKQIIERAFQKHENNSLMLLARSKQTVHSFLNQLEKVMPQVQDLKVVRVNSILNNSEGKILQKFCEALELKTIDKNYTVEMIEQVQEFFKEQKDICLLFIMEDIDYYIESTKQIVLYKILDMLQYCNIPFVFIATSQKVDIVDSFEKRIKSRFSHRQILFYQDDFSQFLNCLQKITEDIPLDYEENRKCDQKYALNQFILHERTIQLLQTMYDQGCGYEELSKTLRILLSNILLKVKEKVKISTNFSCIEQQHNLNYNEADPSEIVQIHQFDNFVAEQYLNSYHLVMNLQYKACEPTMSLKNLCKESLTILVAAKKLAEKTPLFNFEALYQKYRQHVLQVQKGGNVISDMSRQTFLKLFLDLVNQAYFRSESYVDILSVNNKIALAFRVQDLNKMLREDKSKLQTHMQQWAQA